MVADRGPRNDPRTVARDIPGIFDALFPLLVPGVVAHFNRKAYAEPACESIPAETVATSQLQHAMLFEIAVAASEQLLAGRVAIDWDSCLEVAIRRQRRHFDAELPGALSAEDKFVAKWVATNLVEILGGLRAARDNEPLVQEPHIPGYQWIASGTGDFSIGADLIEVKCTAKRFSTSDYRQVMMYWLLSYASSVESNTREWSKAILVNPRLNHVVVLAVDEVIDVIAAGRSKVELLALFSAMVGDHNRHALK